MEHEKYSDGVAFYKKVQRAFFMKRLIGCFGYFWNMVEQIIFKVVTYKLWKKFMHVKRKCIMETVNVPTKFFYN